MPYKDPEKRKEYQKKYQREYYIKRKNLAIQILGGVCVKCGSVEELEFDHIDPKSKYKNITSLLKSSFALESELKKCQLLCGDCHWAKTGKAKHGSGRMYHKGCRCESCRKFNSDYYKKWRESKKGPVV